MTSKLGIGLAAALVACLIMSAAALPAGAATVSASGGTVTFQAGAGELNDLSVSQSAGNFSLTDSGVGAIANGGGCATTGNSATCPSAALSVLMIQLDDMDDQLTLAGVPASCGCFIAAYGGDGNDTMTAGPRGVTVFTGDNGNDTLVGGSANDDLRGGTGDDTIDSGPGSDYIMGGAGTDTLDYSSRAAPLTVTVGNGNFDDGEAGEKDRVFDDIEVVRGGSGDDTLGGNSLDQTFQGGAGKDTVSYSDRTQPVTVDLATSGGETGEADQYDSIENIRGGQADDTLTGDAADNSIDGGPGDDGLDGAGGNDTADYSQRSADLVVDLNGTGGEIGEGDTYTSIEGVAGGTGNDTLLGDDGNDTISGGLGDDTIDGRRGADSMSGGPGTDTIDYSQRNAGVTITPNGAADDGEPGEGDDVAGNFERMLGGAAADLLVGTAASETIEGRGGDDIIDPGLGSDLVLGGDGVDLVSYAGRTQPVAIVPDGAANDGQAGEDDNIGTDVERYLGGGADDYIAGTAASNALFGGAGNDLLVSGGGFDFVDGGDGNDTLLGGESDDDLHGGNGNDVVAGENGADKLNGDSGDDTLDGGAGPDVFNGGPGRDLASYAARSAAVTVSFDSAPNDGQAGERDNLRGDVEDVATGGGGDSIDSRDGIANGVSCGAGRDEVVAEQHDSVDHATCESVTVVGAGAAGAMVTSRKLRMSRKGRVSIRMHCGGSSGTCKGRLTLRSAKRVRSRRHSKKRRLTIVRKRFKIAAGKNKTLRVRVKKNARRAIKRMKKLSLRASISPSSGTKVMGSSIKRLTIRASKGRKR